MRDNLPLMALVFACGLGLVSVGCGQTKPSTAAADAGQAGDAGATPDGALAGDAGDPDAGDPDAGDPDAGDPDSTASDVGAAPTVAGIHGLSPIAIFGRSSVFSGAKNTVFTAKKAMTTKLVKPIKLSGTGKTLPAGTLVKVWTYDTACAQPGCLQLNTATAADLKSVNAATLTRDGTPSTLNVGDYSYVANASVRYVWRWQLMGDKPDDSAAQIAQLKKMGVHFSPTLSADRIAYRMPGYPNGRSCMTKDLTEKFDPAFGYSKLYFEWVTKIIKDYGEIISMIIIENEVDQDGNTWCEPTGVRDGYAKMVITAKYAVQQAKSDTLVADSGLMGSTWARLAIRDFAKQRLALVTAGKTPTAQLDRDILELASQLNKKLPVTNAATPDWPAITAAAIKADTTPMQNGMAVIKLLNSGVIDPDLKVTPLDVFNQHNHATSSAIPATQRYLRKVFATKPGDLVINHEMGLLQGKDFKTLAAGHASLLALTEFTPTRTFKPSGEIEQQKGVMVGKTLIPIAPRELEISPVELAKKFIHSIGSGVSMAFLFAYNESPGHVQIYPVQDGQQNHYFRELGLNFPSCLTNDHLIVPDNMRTFLQLRRVFDSAILSHTYSRGKQLETYTFKMKTKTATVTWLQAYKSNIGKTVTWSVSAQPSCKRYDIEGFEITPKGGKITVGFDPVYEVCPS